MLARNSVHWIILPLVLSLLSFLVSVLLSVFFILIFLLFLIFFRDPERNIGEGIVSPADGNLSNIEDEQDNLRISILMGITDVHVNRAPLDGKVKSMKHITGKHVLAMSKDSEANERLITILDTDIGSVKIAQIAGAFARRIESYIMEGDILSKGQKIGMIRFGSRVDLYLPKKRVRMVAELGSSVKAGSSNLALVV
jgi:phosphatidylserine decarboxylase